MRHTFRAAAVLAIATLVIVSANRASALTISLRTAPQQRDITTATVALTSIGASTGWGRLELASSSRDGSIDRGLVQLFDLTPGVVHSVVVGDHVLATVASDPFGDAELRIGRDEDRPVTLPSGLDDRAGSLSVGVFDDSWRLVLEGSLKVRRSLSSDDSRTVHEERVRLDDVAFTGAAGMAKVEREAFGKQKLETRASGLTAGARYQVQVDGVQAAVVTADAVGQAWLELEAPDDSNPLPQALQPVEALRLVEWVGAEGTVLAGSLTGISSANDDPPGDDNGGRGNDDPPGDDNGGRGNDDPPGDDNGGGGHGGDDGANHP